VILTWGSFDINSNFYVDTVGHFSTDNKKVVITFDDGPDPEITPEILDVLAEFKAKAAFFCIGKKIADGENIIRRIHDEGHEIGLHSFSHSFVYDFYPTAFVIQDLKRNRLAVKNLIGYIPSFFRPPYGVTNPAIGKAIRKENYKVIGWSIRSLDTVIKNEDKILKRMIRHTKPGSIILLHDHLKSTPGILYRYLTFLKEQDYQVLKLSEALQTKPYVS
jgi:peptidoglycan/xylan/chitin deacetylase (PgdA/CDA1 family)